MKIMAAITDRKFLVEMDEDEIAKAAGFSTTWSKEFEKLNGGRQIKVGTSFRVDAAYDFHARVSSHHIEAEKSARTLRALADMIDGALPDVVIPDFDEVQQ
jgi:hypothetical protein